MSLHDLHYLAPYIILSLGGLLVLMLGIVPGGNERQLPFWGAVLVLLLTAISATALLDSQHTVEQFLEINRFTQGCTLFFTAIAFAVLVLSRAHKALHGERDESYYALILFALLGMVMIPAAINLIGFFIGMELMTISGFCLVAWAPQRTGAIEAATKYLITAGVAGAFLLLGIALIYAGSGTLNTAALTSQLIDPRAQSLLVLAGFGLMLVGIGFELALVPFHCWLADLYQGAPAPVVAFIGSIGKLSLIAYLIQLSTDLGIVWHALQPLIMTLAVLSMVMGNLLALRQQNLKRILAYSSVAHFGYILIPLASFGLSATSRLFNDIAIMYYGISYAVMTIASLAVVTLVEQPGHSGELREYEGLGRKQVGLGIVMTLAILSLAGIPPLAGFFAKLMVFYSALNQGYLIVAIIAALTSAISLYYYLRILLTLYRGPAEQPLGAALEPTGAMTMTVNRAFIWVPALACIAVIVLGIAVQPLLELTIHLLP